MRMLGITGVFCEAVALPAQPADPHVPAAVECSSA